MDDSNSTAQATDRTHERIDDVAESMKEHAASVTDAGARGAHQAADTAADWRERGSNAFDNARGFVRDRPVTSVALALAAGWLVGRLLSSRS